ncbi:MAG: hypothetical protein OET18_05285 [Desulfobacterales bacterium]|nr:hypothetical protein [Desulfobacterales bacterium]
MKIYKAVKTEEKAKEIINNYVSDNNLTGGYFEKASCQCGCGETQCINWTNSKTGLMVAICCICGDDDAFLNEVINL